MFHPAPFFIGLRYLRAKKHSRFISLISLISISGIALGVLVLITVLSVLNGFDREIKKQIFGMISPITIMQNQSGIKHWSTLSQKLQKYPGIIGVAPFTTGQILLTNLNMTRPAQLTGILPVNERTVSDLASSMSHGNLLNLKAGRYGIILGQDLAKQLKVHVGDQLTLASTKGALNNLNPQFEFKNVTVVGIFHAGGGNMGFDSKLAFMHLTDTQHLLGLKNRIHGFHLNTAEIDHAPIIADNLAHQLSPSMMIWDWTQQLGDFFENIRLTKTLMFFIFILIIAVAIFNLVCTLVMVVKTKEPDIAILRTLGMTRYMILMIFIVEGTLIGLGGTLLGLIGGIVLSLNLATLSQSVQSLFHTELISSHVYFVNYLPSQLQWQDVTCISIIAITLSLFATLYPAWRASKVEPVEALRIVD